MCRSCDISIWAIDDEGNDEEKTDQHLYENKRRREYSHERGGEESEGYYLLVPSCEYSLRRRGKGREGRGKKEGGRGKGGEERRKSEREKQRLNK